MPPSEEDPQASREMDLARAACAGDKAAFGELYKFLYPRVHRTVWAMVSSESEAHDVAQEAWIKAWERRDRFTFASAYSTWIHRIAVNTALDWLRKRKRLRNRFRRFFRAPDGGTEEQPAEPAVRLPTHVLENKELGRAIEAALATLPEEQRMVLVLREYEGYSYGEIAKLVGCKTGTVMSRLHLARRKLKERLSKEMP